MTAVFWSGGIAATAATAFVLTGCAVYSQRSKAGQQVASPTSGPEIVRDGFSVTGDLSRWAVEQRPGGSVSVGGGVLTIMDDAGCTVWLKQKLRAPLRIQYRATVTGGARVSDLNCFWMATDPRQPAAKPDDFFSPANGRDGTFASYDKLKTYYVGFGGNGNTTTRFRRYDGNGARPLRAEDDHQEASALLEGGREYRIEINVLRDGRTTWARDGVVWFTYDDPEPLREGWFGFRTVASRIEIRDFVVTGL